MDGCAFTTEDTDLKYKELHGVCFVFVKWNYLRIKYVVNLCGALSALCGKKKSRKVSVVNYSPQSTQS
jgi:hypothetical protein